MSRSINNVILLGNLGQDPKLSYTQNGNAKVRFSMCTNKPTKNQDGTWGERAQWHNIVAWGKLAENAAKFLAKGRQALVRGEVETRSFEDRNTGEKRYITEITAGDIVFLSDGGSGGSQGGNPGWGGGSQQGNRGGGGFQAPPANRQQQQQPKQPPEPPPFDDDDQIPF